MDEQNMQQEPQNEGNDSFLDGWEETGPRLEETAPGGDSGKQAGEQEGGLAAGDGGGIHPDTGGTQSGGAGGEEVPPAGGNGGGAQPGSGGPGGEGLPPAGGSGQGDGQPEGGQQPSPSKTWTLDYMGQAVTVSEADIPSLTEKALDYDRVRSAYEESKPVMDLFRGFAQQAGISVQEYVGRLRAQAKQAQGMDERSARQAVEMEDREARVSAQEEADRQRRAAQLQAQARQMQRQARIQSDVQEFISVFPNAARDFNSIPKEVWDAVNGGMSLVAAYARYNGAQAQANAQAAAEEQRRQEAVQQQNAKNAGASTGSMRSAGSSHGPKDPFLEGWDE